MSVLSHKDLRAPSIRSPRNPSKLGRAWAPGRRPSTPRAFGLVGALVVLGCGDDDAARPPAPPPGPPVLSIEKIRPAGRAPWSPGDEPCIAPGLDAAGTVVVEIGERAGNEQLRNWTFRPFQGCGNVPQCGLVLVTLMDAETQAIRYQVAHTRVAIPIEFTKLGLPEASYDLRVELIDDQGFPFRVEGGIAVSEISDLAIRSDCAPASGDAGRDAGVPDGGAFDGSPILAPEAGIDAAFVDASLDAAIPGDAQAEASVSRDASRADGASEDAGPVDASVDAASDG